MIALWKPPELTTKEHTPTTASPKPMVNPEGLDTHQAQAKPPAWKQRLDSYEAKEDEKRQV